VPGPASSSAPAHRPSAERAAAAGDLPAAVNPVLRDLAGTRAAAEYELILANLRCGGISRERMAERLGISPRTLRYKLARMRAAGIGVENSGSGV